MSIEIGKAAFSGFGLIGRHPLSVLIWGLLYLILLGVPSLYMMSQVGPAWLQMVQAAAQAKASGASPAETNATMMQMLPMMQKAGALGWLITLLGLVVRAVLVTAVLRAVLEPANQGFCYLRLGMQELWQLLLAIAMFVLFVVGFVCIALVGGLLSVIMGSLGPVAVLGRFVLTLGIFIAFVYFALRFSLAPAMTFKDKTFRLFESWTMTRGHVGALFLIVLILIVLVLIFELVVGGAAIGYIFSNRAMLQNSTDPSAFFKSLAPIAAIGVAVGSLLSGAVLAIFLAPFATAYKQLTPVAAAPEVF
jgi:hypothetical protein